MKNTARIVTGLIILSLMSQSLNAADTNIETNTESNAKPKTYFICFLAIGVAAGFVVYSIYRCVQTAAITNAPPPPPNTNTNSTGGNFVFTPKDLTPPGFTNIYTGTNNFGPAPAPGIVYFNTILATNNDQNVETKFDISTNGWTDWQGNPYTWFFTTYTDPTGPHTQTSTNLANWSDASYTVNMWLSSSISPDTNMQYFINMTTVLYDNSGIPLLTNWSAISTNAPINAGVRATAPEMFFRAVTPD